MAWPNSTAEVGVDTGSPVEMLLGAWQLATSFEHTALLENDPGFLSLKQGAVHHDLEGLV
jgi:hypothetical protein